MCIVRRMDDAFRKGLIPSRSPDVIFTPLVSQFLVLFDGDSFRGRLFTLMRNPEERIVSLTTHQIENQTLEDFAKSEVAGQDWRMIEGINRWDMELFKYAEQVFEEQRRILLKYVAHTIKIQK